MSRLLSEAIFMSLCASFCSSRDRHSLLVPLSAQHHYRYRCLPMLIWVTLLNSAHKHTHTHAFETKLTRRHMAKRHASRKSSSSNRLRSIVKWLEQISRRISPKGRQIPSKSSIHARHCVLFDWPRSLRLELTLWHSTVIALNLPFPVFPPI